MIILTVIHLKLIYIISQKFGLFLNVFELSLLLYASPKLQKKENIENIYNCTIFTVLKNYFY